MYLILKNPKTPNRFQHLQIGYILRHIMISFIKIKSVEKFNYNIKQGHRLLYYMNNPRLITDPCLIPQKIPNLGQVRDLSMKNIDRFRVTSWSRLLIRAPTRPASVMADFPQTLIVLIMCLSQVSSKNQTISDVCWSNCLPLHVFYHYLTDTLLSLLFFVN